MGNKNKGTDNLNQVIVPEEKLEEVVEIKEITENVNEEIIEADATILKENELTEKWEKSGLLDGLTLLEEQPNDVDALTIETPLNENEESIEEPYIPLLITESPKVKRSPNSYTLDEMREYRRTGKLVD